MLSLGIETSCDETAASVVKDGEVVLSSVVASSIKLHQKYKGIIPEIASRAHIEYISLVVRQALSRAGKEIDGIGLICVTRGPGLIGSLLVGISFAKALSLALKKPIIAVDHLEAHIYASFLSTRTDVSGPQHKKPKMPFIGLVVSGGHTSLFLVKGGFFFKRIGVTMDDAAGEAFDKVAKILGLGYPGGPIIERLARQGNTKKIKLSCQGSGDLDFSFSGIKTAVLYKVHNVQQSTVHRKDMAAGFQRAVVEALIEKSFAACVRYKTDTLVVGGGVAANHYLQSRFLEESPSRNIEVYFPGLALSLDNAAMIAGLGYQLFKKGKVSNYSMSAEVA